jgi:VIT1/CCC1 family predicted Fe2+/Mn2+ transporter
VRTAPATDPRLGEQLVLDELFDLSLYTALRDVTSGDVRRTLGELVAVETRHFEFWQDFFGIRRTRLDARRRLKLAVLYLVSRIFGGLGVQIVLEAIEVYGVRKYLALWDAYQGGPLGEAVRGILVDELKHEDQMVSGLTERRMSPQRIRNIFLGLNDGLVEILGAVSGFFGAFVNPVTVLLAASTTAVAGALSMAAGAWVASSSEQEVALTERRRRRFLGEAVGAGDGDRPWISAVIVGASYFAGAVVPVFPVLLGATTALASILTAAGVIMVVSLLLAFLSGMSARRRVAMNLVIVAAAAGITYAIGFLIRALWGIDV